MTPPVCDCHIHIIGEARAHPQRPAGAPPRPVRSVSDLWAAASGTPVGRFVVVQPSFYGFDNSCLLASLRQLGDNGRGVAQIDPARPDRAMIAELDAAGVRGLRVNAYSPFGLQDGTGFAEAFDAAVAIARDAGWHVQVIAALPTLFAARERIFEAGCAVVLDHYGLPSTAAAGAEEAAMLRDLLASPRVWIKLSAPYRTGDDPVAIRPLADWLRLCVAAAPERCVWGSDWPHTPPHSRDAAEYAGYRAIEHAAIFDAFDAALDDAYLRAAILCDNPDRLYFA